jgi:hypothetical protein
MGMSVALSDVRGVNFWGARRDRAQRAEREPRGGRHRHAGPSGKENSAIDAGLRSEL